MLRRRVPDSYWSSAGGWGMRTTPRGECPMASRGRREDLRRLAMWLTVEEPQLRAVIDEALDTVQAVASGAFWAEAKGSPECHQEAPFSVRESRDGVPTVLSGVIDLVHRAGDGWKI